MKNKGKNILVGVCGGISAYKVCELVRRLKQGGFAVKVMMTPAAEHFVTPLVFQTLSENPVYTGMFKAQETKSITHISLGQWAEVCVVAPLSANTLSKLVCGICDNLLTTVICALPDKVPVLLSPAMNEQMWKNPVIVENFNKLKKIKRYSIMLPRPGKLACGGCGQGRMPEPEDIYQKIRSIAGRRP